MKGVGKVLLRVVRWAINKLENAALLWIGRVLPRPVQGRVLLVSQVAYTGGTFTFFKNAVEALQSDGWKVELALLERSPSPKVLEYCVDRSVGVHRISPRVPLFSLLRLNSVVRTGRYSLLLGSSGGLDFFSFLFAFRLPVVLVFHTVIHQSLSPRDLELLKKLLRPEHRLVAVSKAAQATLVHHGRTVLLPGVARYLYNYVTDRRATPSPRGLSVITIGHVTEYKNPWVWIEVARQVLARLPEVTFTWVGNGDLLERCADAVRGEPAIRFVGFHRNVDEFLSGAAVLFHPSKTESFGLAVAEAMMWGVPSVVSDAGALPELVENGSTGLVFPLTQPEVAVDELVSLLSLSDEERRLWGQRARLGYERRFTEASWVRSFRELLPKETRIQ